MISLIIGCILGGLGMFGLYTMRKAHMHTRYTSDLEHTNRELEEKKERLEKHIKQERETIEEDRLFAEEEYKEKNDILNRKEKKLTSKQNDFKEREKEISKQQQEAHQQENKTIENRKKLIDELSQKVQLKPEEFRPTILNEHIEDLEENAPIMEQKEKEHLEGGEENTIAENIMQMAIHKYSKRNAARVQLNPIAVPKEIWQKHAQAFDEIIQASGIECVYEEEKNTLYISHFNLVRRSIAHRAIEKAIKQKNFESSFIKQSLKESSDDAHKHMMEIGKKTFTLLDLDQYNFPDELKKLVGRMYYRTSYGQNVLEHSIEVAYFAEMLAYELGLDTRVAKIAGLFHDIGKAIDQDTEGAHDHLSKQILEEYNIEYAIVHAAWNHHDAIPMETLEARIVQAADGLSATRPGSRRESSDQFAARCQMLEDKAYEHKEVQKAFVIQAGREIRALFDPRNVSEERMRKVIKTIATDVEAEGGYPGEILIHGVRELRAIHRTKERKEKVS